MVGGRASIRSEHRLRSEAQAAATELVRSGISMTEVRQRWALLDTFVLRGSSPRHVYNFGARPAVVVAKVAAATEAIEVTEGTEGTDADEADEVAEVAEVA
jgi:hypothetical protein